jgi:hypothetical protein
MCVVIDHAIGHREERKLIQADARSRQDVSCPFPRARSRLDYPRATRRLAKACSIHFTCPTTAPNAQYALSGSVKASRDEATRLKCCASDTQGANVLECLGDRLASYRKPAELKRALKTLTQCPSIAEAIPHIRSAAGIRSPIDSLAVSDGQRARFCWI